MKMRGTSDRLVVAALDEFPSTVISREIKSFSASEMCVEALKHDALNVRRRELRLCLCTSEKAFFDNGVNAPVSVHDLGHPEIDGYGDQSDRLVLGEPLRGH
jgi:hypothetical protein